MKHNYTRVGSAILLLSSFVFGLNACTKTEEVPASLAAACVETPNITINGVDASSITVLPGTALTFATANTGVTSLQVSSDSGKTWAPNTTVTASLTAAAEAKSITYRVRVNECPVYSSITVITNTHAAAAPILDVFNNKAVLAGQTVTFTVVSPGIVNKVEMSLPGGEFTPIATSADTSRTMVTLTIPADAKDSVKYIFRTNGEIGSDFTKKFVIATAPITNVLYTKPVLAGQKVTFVIVSPGTVNKVEMSLPGETFTPIATSPDSSRTTVSFTIPYEAKDSIKYVFRTNGDAGSDYTQKVIIASPASAPITNVLYTKPVQAGQTVTFVVVSPGSIERVEMSLPGETFTPIATSTTDSRSTVTFTIPKDAKDNVTYVFRTNDDAGSDYTQKIEIAPSPDATISKVEYNKPVYAGQEVSYTVTGKGIINKIEMSLEGTFAALATTTTGNTLSLMVPVEAKDSIKYVFRLNGDPATDYTKKVYLTRTAAPTVTVNEKTGNSFFLPPGTEIVFAGTGTGVSSIQISADSGKTYTTSTTATVTITNPFAYGIAADSGRVISYKVRANNNSPATDIIIGGVQPFGTVKCKGAGPGDIDIYLSKAYDLPAVTGAFGAWGPIADTVGAIAKFDGKYNQNVIMSKVAGNSSKAYKAFYICNKGAGWYLPAADELVKALSSPSSPLDAGGNMWTSTEASRDKAIFLTPPPSVNKTEQTKSTSLSVRCAWHL